MHSRYGVSDEWDVCRGTPVICEDGNECTFESCIPFRAACLSMPTTACDDGDDCTVGDLCVAGSCAPGMSRSVNALLTRTAQRIKSLRWVYLLRSGGVFGPPNTCQEDTSAVTCASDLDTDCMKNLCDPAQGLCLFTPLNNGTECDDDNLCTQLDGCLGGECSGNEVICTDGNPCTDDLCLSGIGCDFPNNSQGCSDGNA